MRKPNFFIVGAPKTGTSALSHYLAQHPDIFLPNYELHYWGVPDWASTADRSRNDQDLSEYLSLFARVKKEQFIGERSVEYLYSTAATHNIKGNFPAAKVIALIRKPSEMIHSLHSMMVRLNQEPLKDFNEAIMAHRNRKQVIHNGTHPHYFTFYKETVRYSTHLERYFNVFGRENVHVIMYDELKDGPRGMYLELLSFLGAQFCSFPEFEIVNPNQVPRHQWLRSSVEHIHRAQPLKRVLRPLVPVHWRKQLWRWTKLLTSKPAPRIGMEVSLQEALDEEFEPEIRKLEDLLGRDLASWRQGWLAEKA